ncbi:uncharacterized protein MJAP1_000165 [Malassezia japonica]|uniref:Methyltransferase type 11 domain-containing protein n=1 Tax=Malassezia japonica TaxID=223818 RepID=A0AAF0F2T4_9BASI|nr:uncharacterized protein MJAP1_000165 [Malassezia japonica]WFD37223.1 hypothetical protein MJAP1_000165 [Malassezia japonica]
MHSVARRGFDSSGANGLYDRARPSYPEEVVDQMLSAPRARGPLRIAEVGAGTGIATRLLLEGAHSHGGLARMHAFDPSTGMLHHLQQSLFGTPDGPGLVEKLKLEGKLASDAQVLIGEGAFDSFQAGADNDLVVIAQAWHWCPDFDQALAHIATQLRPGGVLALVWNLEDRDAAPWIAKLRDLYEKFEDGAPQYRHMAWKKMYKTPSFEKYFTELEPTHQLRKLPTTFDGVVDRMLSKSYVSVLPDEQKERLAQDAFRILSAPDSETGRE